MKKSILITVIIGVVTVFGCRHARNESHSRLFFDEAIEDSLKAYVNQVNNLRQISSDAVITIILSYNDLQNDTTLTFDVSDFPFDIVSVNDFDDTPQEQIQINKGYMIVGNRKCWIRYVGSEQFKDIINESQLLDDVAYEDCFTLDNICLFRRNVHRKYEFKGHSFIVPVERSGT